MFCIRGSELNYTGTNGAVICGIGGVFGRQLGWDVRTLFCHGKVANFCLGVLIVLLRILLVVTCKEPSTNIMTSFLCSKLSMTQLYDITMIKVLTKSSTTESLTWTWTFSTLDESHAFKSLLRDTRVQPRLSVVTNLFSNI